MNSTSQAPAFFNKDNTYMSNEAADYLWHHEFTIPEENTFSGSAQRAFTTGVITSKAKKRNHSGTTYHDDSTYCLSYIGAIYICVPTAD